MKIFTILKTRNTYTGTGVHTTVFPPIVATERGEARRIVEMNATGEYTRGGIFGSLETKEYQLEDGWLEFEIWESEISITI